MHLRPTLGISLVLAAAAATLTAAGCSSTDNGNIAAAKPAVVGTNPGPNGAVVRDGGGASPNVGRPGENAANPATASGAVIASGRHNLLGVTDDNFIIYNDVADNAVKAVPIGGGAPVLLAANARTIGQDTDIVISGKVVFIWTDTDYNGNGRLRAWSLASGSPQELAPLAQYGAGSSRAAASADGTKLVFAATTGDGGSELDLRGATLGNGAPTPTSLVTSVANTNDCPINIQFTSLAVAVTSACAAGTTVRQVRAFDGMASFASHGLYDTADPSQAGVATTAKGDRGLVFGSGSGGPGTGPAVVVGLGANAGPATVIGNNVTSAYLSPDGAFVIYQTSAGGLHRATIGGPDIELVNAGVTGILAVSPDFHWALTSAGTDTLDGGVNDAGTAIAIPVAGVSIASLDTSSLSGLVTTVTGAAGPGMNPGGDGFTKDGSHALYFSDVNSSGSGTLRTRAVGAAGGDKTPSTDATRVWAIAGSKVLIMERSADGATAALKSFDTAGQADSATVIASGALGMPSASPDGKKVIYFSADAPSGAGIYAADVP